MEQRKLVGGAFLTLANLMVLVVGGLFLYNQYIQPKVESFGAGFDDRNKVTLLGSSSNLVSLPNSLVFGNSTTTDAGGAVTDGGFTFTQLIATSGIRKVILNFSLVGGTATSTAYVRQMGSFDGSSFFDIATSTAIINASSTTISITPLGGRITPGLATTTIALPFAVDGYPFTRFMVYGDNLSTDPNDGVQAWITATLVEDYAR